MKIHVIHAPQGPGMSGRTAEHCARCRRHLADAAEREEALCCTCALEMELFERDERRDWRLEPGRR